MDQQQPDDPTEFNPWYYQLRPQEEYLDFNSSLPGSEPPDSFNSTLYPYEDEGDDGLYTQDDYYNNKWLLILPRVAGFISILAVICVAMETFIELRHKPQNSRHTRTTTAKNVSTITHIQFFYQIPLFCHALTFVLGTTPAPQGQAWGAFGNTQTCSFQGFIMQFGTHGGLFWDAALSTNYLLMVRYKVAEMQLQSYKKYYHWVIWPIALVASIYPLTQQMYNLNGTVCWLESYPNNCEGDECLRGAGAPLWQSAASLLAMLHLVYTITVMICLYCAIRGLENHNHHHNSSQLVSDNASGDASTATATTRQSHNYRRHSRAVAIQGMWYASGMILTTLPTPVYIVLWNTAGLWNDGFAIFATAIMGLLGYVNLVLFLRPRKVDHCHTQYAKLWRRAHSWLFDYDYYQWIRQQWIYQQVCCKDDNRGDDHNVATASNTPSRLSASNPAAGPKRSRSVSPNNPCQQHRKPLPSILEDDALPDDDAPKGGKWTGFLVKVKDQNQKVSQWISELGHSQASSDSGWSESESQSHSQCDVESRDNAPSLPSRIRSEVEALGGCDDTGSMSASARTAPPTMPIRLVSEVEPNDINTDLPIMPTRLVSEVEPNNPDLEERPPQIPQRYTSELETVESPPHITQRYTSEVEVHPPQLPQRYTSEVEPQSPPHNPPHISQRYTSEVEALVLPQRYASEVEPQSPPHRSSVQAPQLTRRCTSEAESQSPPHKPQRCTPEIEHSNEKVEHPPPHTPQRYSNGKSAPQLPQRLVSEIELPESPIIPTTEQGVYLSNAKIIRVASDIELSESESSFTPAVPRQRLQPPPPSSWQVDFQGPPCQPLRVESEIDVLDSSYSSNHSSSLRSFTVSSSYQNNNEMDLSEGSTSTLEGSMGSRLYQSQSALPPTRPCRYPSELWEESVSKHNGSSLLLPLDAITEHSTDTLLTNSPKREKGGCILNGGESMELDACSFGGDASLPVTGNP